MKIITVYIRFRVPLTAVKPLSHGQLVSAIEKFLLIF